MSTSTLDALRALQTAPAAVTPAVAPRRSTRAVFVGLAAAGLIAAMTAVFSLVQDGLLTARERKAAVEVDALVAGAARFGAAVRTFGAAREPQEQWFSNASALVAELRQRTHDADATLAGIAMTPRARVAESVQAAGDAVERARANAEANKDLMAHDVIDSNGKPAADALDAALLALRSAMADEIGGRRSWWRTAASVVLTAWALVWGLGLAWFARRREETPSVPAQREAGTRPLAAEPSLAAAPAASVAAPEPAPALAGLPQLPLRGSETVADACEAVAGMTDAAQIGPALQGMAEALGASGLVLWMRDGDALAAAAAHGYPPGLPQRLGRVTAGDRNLIARAWQERASQTAPEAPGQRAAVASPIGAPGAVTGVLSAELPLGREADADVVATSRILAAQLSMVLGESAASGVAPRLEATGS